MSESATASTEARRPPCARAAARQTWADRLTRFTASGLRPAAFCAQEGVSLPSFYAWKRRLAAADPGRTHPTSSPESGPRWLPVRLAAAAPTLELVLPRGLVLRVPPGSDLTWVRSLVDALGEAPC